MGELVHWVKTAPFAKTHHAPALACPSYGCFAQQRIGREGKDGHHRHQPHTALILMFADQHVDRDGRSVDPQERPQTDLEHQAAFEGIAPSVKRRERHLVFELSRPLTREQATWLDELEGKLFDRFHMKDEFEVKLDTLPEKAHDNRKAAAHE
jgi:hypothetical protein